MARHEHLDGWDVVAQEILSVDPETGSLVPGWSLVFTEQGAERPSTITFAFEEHVRDYLLDALAQRKRIVPAHMGDLARLQNP